MALTLLLICGTIVTLTFDMIGSYSWISAAQRDIYVDHTTVLSAVEKTKGRIIQANLASGDIKRGDGISKSTLDLADLRIGKWCIPRYDVRSGASKRELEVEVYDLRFNFNDLTSTAKAAQDLPPIYKADWAGPYGFYLIRAKLYDSRNRLIRMAEEAFVQAF